MPHIGLEHDGSRHDARLVLNIAADEHDSTHFADGTAESDKQDRQQLGAALVQQAQKLAFAREAHAVRRFMDERRDARNRSG